MSQELLRLVDGICRDKNIEKELVLQGVSEKVRCAKMRSLGIIA